MTLELTKAAIVEQATTTGTIIAVAYSPELIDGIRKELHGSAEVRRWGCDGSVGGASCCGVGRL